MFPSIELIVQSVDDSKQSFTYDVHYSELKVDSDVVWKGRLNSIQNSSRIRDLTLFKGGIWTSNKEGRWPGHWKIPFIVTSLDLRFCDTLYKNIFLIKILWLGKSLKTSFFDGRHKRMTSYKLKYAKITPMMSMFPVTDYNTFNYLIILLLVRWMKLKVSD